MSAPRGTEGNLAYMVGLMDYGKDDVSRPAAIPGWTRNRLLHRRFESRTFLDEPGRSRCGAFTGLSADAGYARGDADDALPLRSITAAAPRDRESSRSSARLRRISPRRDCRITPDFDGTVQLSFALNLWAPHQPRFALAKLSGDEMQEAVAAHNLNFTAMPPATPDRAAVWYHGDTHVSPPTATRKDLTLWLDGRAEQGLAMAEAAAIALAGQALKPADATLYNSDYRLALNLKVKYKKAKRILRQVRRRLARRLGRRREGRSGAREIRTQRRLRRAARRAPRCVERSVAFGHRDRRRCRRADGGALGSVLPAVDIHAGHALADRRLRDDAGLFRPRFLGRDTWIFPALLLLHPDRAKSLVDVPRAYAACGAGARARSRIQGREISVGSGSGKRHRADAAFRRYVLGEREIHVNADVAIAQWQYWLATHDRDMAERIRLAGDPQPRRFLGEPRDVERRRAIATKSCTSPRLPRATTTCRTTRSPTPRRRRRCASPLRPRVSSAKGPIRIGPMSRTSCTFRFRKRSSATTTSIRACRASRGRAVRSGC